MYPPVCTHTQNCTCIINVYMYIVNVHVFTIVCTHQKKCTYIAVVS